MMTLNQSTITYSYHFLSETLITFLAIIPILHVYFHHVPYVAFFLVMISFTLLFALLTRWTSHYGPYLFVTPLMFVAFYWLNFHWILSALLAVFFIWRYIQVRSEQHNHREQIYIRWALVFAVISAFIVDDKKLIGYLFVLFLVLIVGYLSRHLMSVSRNNQQSFNHMLWIYLIGSMTIGTGIIYFLFPAVRLLIGTVWRGFIYAILLFGSQGVKLLASIKWFDGAFDPEDLPPQDMDGADDSHSEKIDTVDTSIFEFVVKTFLWAIIVAIVGYLLWRAYKLYQHRFTSLKTLEGPATISHKSLEATNRNRGGIISQILDRFRQTPRHPIRKLVYDFERKVSGTAFARKSHETVEDWLERLQINSELKIYQQVRYGELEVPEQAIEQLQMELKNIEHLSEDDDSLK